MALSQRVLRGECRECAGRTHVDVSQASMAASEYQLADDHGGNSVTGLAATGSEVLHTGCAPNMNV